MLADGEVFEGEIAGAVPAGGVSTGELVFNTSMSGYQEVVTDPSYAGQVDLLHLSLTSGATGSLL